jgi:hypothetical protein
VGLIAWAKLLREDDERDDIRRRRRLFFDSFLSSLVALPLVDEPLLCREDRFSLLPRLLVDCLLLTIEAGLLRVGEEESGLDDGLDERTDGGRSTVDGFVLAPKGRDDPC